jgi:acyl-coenzyme A thioesterase PaaI-like protein
MGSAARFAIDAPVLTLDLHINFVARGRGVLTAEGRIVRAGRSIVFAEAEARGGQGEIVARASGVFKRRANAIAERDD